MAPTKRIDADDKQPNPTLTRARCSTRSGARNPRRGLGTEAEEDGSLTLDRRFQIWGFEPVLPDDLPGRQNEFIRDGLEHVGHYFALHFALDPPNRPHFRLLDPSAL